MSQNKTYNKTTILDRNERILILKEGLLNGKTIEQIANDCQCSSRTINRDLKEWKSDDGFTGWALTEFMGLYRQVPLLEKYHSMLKIVLKTEK